MKFPSICLIALWFGPWPSWLKFWLASCRHNPTIDWLLLTDQPAPQSTPPNVHVAYYTLDAFNEDARHIFGMPITVTEPYKLCDYRPAFGHIFENDLKDFDYWGHTDLDVIYGNLRAFLPRIVDNSRRYDIPETQPDVITPRPEYLSGHFTLYRNTPTINALYQQSQDWQKIFTSDQYTNFDECGGLWPDLLRNRSLSDCPPTWDSMTHVVHRLAQSNQINTLHTHGLRERFEIDKHFLLRWRKGDLGIYYGTERLMYFHFHTLKNAQHFQVPAWSYVPNTFYISDNGFFV